MINIIGFVIRKLKSLYTIYMNKWILTKVGRNGKNSKIVYPFKIIGPENIYLEEGASIGMGATIFTKKAKVYSGKKSFSGPNLTMISGDHPYQIGMYMLDIVKK